MTLRILKWGAIGLGGLCLLVGVLILWGASGAKLTLSPEDVPAAQTVDQPAGFRDFPLMLAHPYLKARAQSGVRSGYSIALARDGVLQQAFRHGYKNRDVGTRITSDTRFRIASMTKPITAVGAMILVERGTIGLDDPVAKYIPAFAEATVAASPQATLPPSGDQGHIERVALQTPITIRHLLTFTAGIGASNGTATSTLDEIWFETLGPVSSLVSLEARADLIARLPLYHQPGERWHYGLSLTVMARIIEIASGMAFEDFLEAEIFTPLGMGATGFMPPPIERNDLATLYTNAPDGSLVTRPDRPYDRKGRIGGDGGLVSTLPDYMRFALMLWNEGTYDGVQILKPESVAQMTTPHVMGGVLADFGIEGLGWGYGLATVVDAKASLMPDHPGDFFWSGINGTHFWVSRETGVVYVYMTQFRASPGTDAIPPGAEIPFIVQGLANASLR